MVSRSPSGFGRARQVLFLLAGSLALGLGALGVVLPLLPTAPFVILAAFCFARGSRRIHGWLLGNRVFGAVLQDYLAGKGASLRVKVWTLAFLWASIGLSAGLAVSHLWARMLLGLVGIGVTTHILLIKTRRPSGVPRETPGDS